MLGSHAEFVRLGCIVDLKQKLSQVFLHKMHLFQNSKELQSGIRNSGEPLKLLQNKGEETYRGEEKGGEGVITNREVSLLFFRSTQGVRLLTSGLPTSF